MWTEYWWGNFLLSGCLEDHQVDWRRVLRLILLWGSEVDGSVLRLFPVVEFEQQRWDKKCHKEWLCSGNILGLCLKVSSSNFNWLSAIMSEDFCSFPQYFLANAEMAPIQPTVPYPYLHIIYNHIFHLIWHGIVKQHWKGAIWNREHKVYKCSLCTFAYWKLLVIANSCNHINFCLSSPVSYVYQKLIVERTA